MGHEWVLIPLCISEGAWVSCHLHAMSLNVILKRSKEDSQSPGCRRLQVPITIPGGGRVRVLSKVRSSISMHIPVGSSCIVAKYRGYRMWLESLWESLYSFYHWQRPGLRSFNSAPDFTSSSKYSLFPYPWLFFERSSWVGFIIANRYQCCYWKMAGEPAHWLQASF